MVKVSVIFVSYNTRDLTIDAIRSVIRKTKKVNYEIIVVDNNSNDNTVEVVNRLFPSVKTIKNKENFGFGYANNIGVSQATGEYMFLLNTDTLLINDVISILCDRLDNDKNISAVGPNIYDFDRNPTVSYSRLLPSFLLDLNEFLFNLSSKFKFINMNFNYSGKLLLHKGSISGAATLIRKDIFENVGGFDKDFFLYYEETDLFKRITSNGGVLASEPNAKLIHYENGSEKIKEITLQRSFKSKFIYLSKHHSVWKIKIHHFNTRIISRTRIVIFSLLRNEEKVGYWELARKIENEEYKKYKMQSFD